MKVGLQLYSCLDKIMDREGLLRTVRAAGAMGYDGVELVSIGGYEAMSAEELKSAAASAGVEIINIHLHVPFAVWFGDLRGALAKVRDIGLKMVTLPWIPEEERSGALYAKIIESIPGWISLCKEYGLAFCYHNHDFELAPYGGATLLEAVAAADDEMLIELDTFWSHFAGKDPVGMMETLGNKLRLVHVKDYNELAPFKQMKFTAVGTGVMDNAAVCKKAEEMGLEWVIVEQDNSAIDTLESARISLEGVRKLLQ